MDVEWKCTCWESLGKCRCHLDAALAENARLRERVDALEMQLDLEDSHAEVARLRERVRELEHLADIKNWDACQQGAAAERASIVADVKAMRNEWAAYGTHETNLKAYACDYLIDRIERADHLAPRRSEPGTPTGPKAGSPDGEGGE